MIDLQKVSIWKRASAYLFDLILLCILVVGIASLMSMLIGYNEYDTQMDAIYADYEQKYGIDFDISMEEYQNLSEAEIKKFDDAYAALNKDENALYVYNMTVYMSLFLISSSILLAYTVLEVVIPLILKNGQTLGKKIFGICLMRPDFVKVNAIQIFARAILGKCTIETMIPVLIILLMYFGAIGRIGPTILGILVMVQAFLLIFSKTKAGIHDRVAYTVAVDYSSQMIFDTKEEMIAYTEAYEAEIASREEP